MSHDRISTSTARDRSERLFRAVDGASVSALSPRLTTGIVLAHVIAACVHLVSIALLLAGIALIVWTWPNLLGIILGSAMAIGGWFLLPRPGRLPDRTVTRDQAPALYALVDEVAAVLKTRPVDVIALDPDVNASFSRVGLRRTTVLTLGLPLWQLLAPQERVAVISHELAHQENGDTARTFLVSRALGTLDAWDDFLTQDPHPEISVSDFAVRWILELVAVVVRGIMSVLLRLFLTETQRAEYLADFLGSRVSGTQALLSVNDTLLRTSACPEALFDATMKTPARDPCYAAIFDRHTALVEGIASGQVDAARERAISHHEDGTHPPTAYRSAFLANRPCDPVVTLDDAGSRRIDAELAPFRDAVGLSLVRRWAYHFD